MGRVHQVQEDGSDLWGGFDQCQRVKGMRLKPIVADEIDFTGTTLWCKGLELA